MTNEEIKAWFESPTSIPVLLVETFANIVTVETPIKLSIGAYPNPDYLPIASIGIDYTETLSLVANGSLSFADLKIENYNRERDHWLTYVWKNRPIVQLLGDVRWARADFFVVFNGYILDIDSQDPDTLNLKLIDRFQQLNSPISELKLGGSGPNKNVVVPNTFGEVHNIAPLLTNEATGEYQYHASTANGVGEVRTDARLRTYTETPATGKFVFTTAVGPDTVTASVQGDNFGGVYRSTVASIIQRIITGYGKESDRLTSADIDLTNFNAFETAHPQTVGIYSANREGVLATCQYLAASVGAQLVPSREGKLRLLKIALPPVGTPRVITQADMDEKMDLRLVERTPVQPTFILGFCKNYTVQQSLTTTIPLAHKSMYEKEWLTVKSTNEPIRLRYKLTAEPVQKDTALQIESQAQTEADRLRALWEQQHGIYEFKGLSKLQDLQLGDAVTIYHPRYNMSEGVSGMVIKLKPNYMDREILVGVLI